MENNLEEIIKLIDTQEQEETKGQILKYLKKWPWFILFATIGVLTGYFIFINSPDRYEAKSRILVKSEENSVNTNLPFDNQMLTNDNRLSLENQIGILKSYTLFQKAMEKLNWNYSWYQKELLYNKDLYKNNPIELVLPPGAKNSKKVPIEIEIINRNDYKIVAKGRTNMTGSYQNIDFEKVVSFGSPVVNDFFNFTLNNKNQLTEGTYLLVFNDINNLTSQFLELTKIDIENANSDIISVRINSTKNPARTVDFINELNNIYIEYGVENKYESSKNSVEFLDSQLARIKESLTTAEENFSNYRRNNQIIDLGQEAQLVYARLEEIEQDRYLTQLQIDYYEDVLQYIDDSKKIEEMVNPSIVGITDNNLDVLLSGLSDLYSRKQELSYSVQDKNPTMIMLDEEIRIARNGLEETIKNLLKATESKMVSLNERYTTVQSRLNRLPETEKRMVSIQREFDLNNELYTYMLQKKAEASITKANIAPEVQVIDEAMLETTYRTGPDIVKFLAAGFMGGAILPVLFFIILGFFNTKIETVSEIEKLSKIPVLEGIVKHKYKTMLPIVKHPRSGIAECFRRVKTNINTIIDHSESIVISINSLVPGEGKSFISSNLAAILSKTDKKVLLIGADLHKPMLHNFLSTKETFGLSNYLNNEKSMEDIIFSTEIANLFFIQGGTIKDSPSDLINNDSFTKLIDYYKTKFDYIIFDNAPLLLVPDTIITSHLADISIYLLRMNISRKEQVKQINKIVSFNKIKRAVILPNDIPEKGYGYGYGYGKKYWKEGYGESKYS